MRYAKYMKQRYLGISLFLLVFLVIGLLVANYLLSQQQDIRQQASSCSEAPVDTQFRIYTGQDTPWVGGAGFPVQVGQAIDVTCFSNNGASLLSGGRLSGRVVLNGITTNLTLPSAPEKKNFPITQAGTYTFTCSNSSGCSNSDSFTVAGPASPSPSPSPSLSPSPSPSPSASPQAGTPVTCTTYQLSDLNKDCKTTIEDYNLFLQDFRTHNAL